MQLRGNEASESQQVDMLKNTSTLEKKASGWNELPHGLGLGWWAGRHPGSRDVELQGLILCTGVTILTIITLQSMWQTFQRLQTFSHLLPSMESVL